MKDIEKLKELQKVDSRIFRIKKMLDAKPKDIAAIESQFSGLTSSLKKLEEDLKQVQLQQKNKELELQTKEETVKKQQAQLFQVKTNKEYNALQLEIEKMKADNSVLEEQIIIGLEKIDGFKKAITAEKEQLAAEEKKMHQTKADITVEVKQLKEELDSLSVQRKRIIEFGIKPEVLSLYERILANRGELAIVPLKGNACSGCFMELRPQVVNELRLGKLLTCETCSRILYVEENG